MMNQGSPHILVVDDHSEIRDLLKRFLEQHGMRVSCARDGKEMKRLLDEREFDLLVLDLMMPGEDGLTLCRELRVKSRLPIIMLTAMGEETDRIIGLEMGADDYLSKPFNPRELLARIKAVMRRFAPRRAVDPSGPLHLDVERHTVTCQGRPVDLSRLEFDLLAVLAGQPGRVFTRDQLLDQAWPDGGCVTDRTVDAHIKSLRKKLPDAELIETVRGVGYRLRDAGPA